MHIHTDYSVKSLFTLGACKWLFTLVKSFMVLQTVHAAKLLFILLCRQTTSLQRGSFHVASIYHYVQMIGHKRNRQIAYLLCGSFQWLLSCIFKLTPVKSLFTLGACKWVFAYVKYSVILQTVLAVKWLITTLGRQMASLQCGFSHVASIYHSV